MDNPNYDKLKSRAAYVKQTGGCQWAKDQPQNKAKFDEEPLKWSPQMRRLSIYRACGYVFIYIVSVGTLLKIYLLNTYTYIHMTECINSFST